MTSAHPTAFPRCISVAVGKGGVGKTSLTSNTAGILAQQGYRVLAISLDPQDNLGEDLGYAHSGASDDGTNLAAAMRGETPLQPLKDVRPRLDVVCGGDALEAAISDIYYGRFLQMVPEGLRDQVEDAVHARSGSRYTHPDYALADALAPIQATYDVILVDCPPGHHILQHQALVASRWLIVPTNTDSSSRKGIARLAERLQAAREINPAVGLLGVALFDVPANATRIRGAAVAAIARDLGTDEPIFRTSIRTARAAAHDARERGQLMLELAADVAAQDPWWKTKTSAPSLARSAKGVAQDYESLALEISGALAAMEASDDQ